jgi:hypothetical protein
MMSEAELNNLWKKKIKINMIPKFLQFWRQNNSFGIEFFKFF